MYSCDKCGQEIKPEHNNLCVVIGVGEAVDNNLHSDQYIRHHVNATLFNKPCRHFLPVYDGENLICEGSPSRAQFIEGQPRDARGFAYTEELEKFYRTAWGKAQEMYPA